MRIAFLDSWSRDPSEGSGTTVAISTLAESLRKLGHEVRFVAGEEDGVPLLRRIRYNWRLHQRILETAPDVALGFDMDGFLLPRRRPYPLVVHLKGVAADEARFEEGLARWRLRFLALLEARNARRADRVVVPSHYSRNHACRAYGLSERHVSVVPEGVDPAPWARVRDAPPPREDATPTILTVGRQYPRKNTITLVQALETVTERVPDARLRVVGGGPELPRLRRQAVASGLEDRVEFLGPLQTMEEVRREYARADCFCLPTLQEGFGIVFLEAMAAGLPVVAGRAGAVPEVVSDGEAGLLVDPRDPGAVAEALVAVLTDRSLSRRMGEAGVERAGGFTSARTAEGVLEVIRAARSSRKAMEESDGGRDRKSDGSPRP